MDAPHRLPGAVADSIWAMIEMCDVRGEGGAYKRQDPWQLLDKLQAPGSPLADQPDSKVGLACSETQHDPLSASSTGGDSAQWQVHGRCHSSYGCQTDARPRITPCVDRTSDVALLDGRSHGPRPRMTAQV